MTQNIEEEQGDEAPIQRDKLYSAPKSSTVRLKIELFILAAELLATVYFLFYEYLSLDALAERESNLKAYGMAHPWLIVGLLFLIYVIVTAFSIPVATVFSMGVAWLFKILFGTLYGFLIAVLLVSFASTCGATLAFLLSRFLFHDVIQRKFGRQLQAINDALRREGAFYLFTLRLIPAVPFFVINVVMGLTPMRVRTYWWVSQLGMLAGTCVYVYAGSQIPSLQVLAEKGAQGVLKPQIFIAFLLLGIFPLAVKKIMQRIRTGTPDISP